MSDLLDEIKEDLDKENFLSFVKRYGKYALYISGAILFIAAAMIYINYRITLKQQELSTSYYNFLGHVKDGLPDDLAKEKDSVYSNLARIDYAVYLRDQKKYKESLEQLIKAIEFSSKEEIKNLAGMHAIFIAMQSNLVEEHSKLFDDLEKSAKSDAPLGGLLIWSLVELETSRKHNDKAAELLKKIDPVSADGSVRLLYNIAKDSIIAKTYGTK